MVDVSDKPQVATQTLVSAQVLADAKKRLNEMTAKWNHGVCWGTCLDLDGKEMVIPHTACHSWVHYAYAKVRDKGALSGWYTTYPKDAKQFLVLSCHSKKRSKTVCSPEATDAIILWMARESPFSEFVLNRDDDDSLLNGGVILLCGPGALTEAQAMWVCKVLRYSTEGAKALDIWLELYKGGVNPLLAVLVCSYVRTIKGATFGYTGVNLHSSVFGRLDGEDDVPSLLAGVVNPDATSTAEVFRSGVKAKGGKSGKGATPSVIIEGFCKPYLKDDGWGGKVTAEGVDGPEFVKCVLKWQRGIEGVEAPPPPQPTSSTVYLELDL